MMKNMKMKTKLILGFSITITITIINIVISDVSTKWAASIVDEASKDEAFMFQNLVGEKLSKPEIEELKEYAKSCGYKPGALLFGGIDDEKLDCIRNQTGAKVIGTLSKSIGFPKLETDISRYRRQHIVGSLFYSAF